MHVRFFEQPLLSGAIGSFLVLSSSSKSSVEGPTCLGKQPWSSERQSVISVRALQPHPILKWMNNGTPSTMQSTWPAIPMHWPFRRGILAPRTPLGFCRSYGSGPLKCGCCTASVLSHFFLAFCSDFCVFQVSIFVFIKNLRFQNCSDLIFLKFQDLKFVHDFDIFSWFLKRFRLLKSSFKKNILEWKEKWANTLMGRHIVSRPSGVASLSAPQGAVYRTSVWSDMKFGWFVESLLTTSWLSSL
jgi:hypothetical protein